MRNSRLDEAAELIDDYYAGDVTDCGLKMSDVVALLRDILIECAHAANERVQRLDASQLSEDERIALLERQTFMRALMRHPSLRSEVDDHGA